MLAGLFQESKRTDISTREKRPDDIAARDRQIEARRVRFIVVKRDTGGPRTANVIARQSLE